MAQYTTEDIRNFVLVGHSGAGKTSLAEAVLHTAGQTNRLGSVDEGTSIFDADDEEKQRKCSIDPGFGHLAWKDKSSFHNDDASVKILCFLDFGMWGLFFQCFSDF